jgi:superfamily II DNA or RNA helicase
VIDHITTHITTKSYGGLIVAPTSAGKTLMITETIRLIGKKALIIVPSISTYDQMISRLNTYIQMQNDETQKDKNSCNLKIGRIRGKLAEIRGNDVCIASLSTFATHEYKESLLREFGVVFIDECETIPTSVYSLGLLKVGFIPYIFGFTATLERSDKMVSEIFISSKTGK